MKETPMSQYTDEHFDEDHCDAYLEHKAFMDNESSAVIPSSWDKWIAALEIEVGHSMDGDQERDGYSLDYAHDAFNAGLTVANYAKQVIKTTKHTHPVVFGRKVDGCPRCEELKAGAAPIQWAPSRQQLDQQRCREIRDHFSSHKHLSGACGVVCTFGEW